MLCICTASLKVTGIALLTVDDDAKLKVSVLPKTEVPTIVLASSLCDMSWSVTTVATLTISHISAHLRSDADLVELK